MGRNPTPAGRHHGPQGRCTFEGLRVRVRVRVGVRVRVALSRAFHFL